MIYSELISIIIPVFNREDFLKETIESVLNQSYKYWELIFIDDGSTDKSIEIINDYIQNDSRIFLFQRNRDPKGASTCRNIGLTHSKGKYIQFFDSDDLMHKEYLAKRLAYLIDNSGFGFCACNFNKIDIENNIIENSSKHHLYCNTLENHLKYFSLTTQSFLLVRHVALQLDKWDETIHRLQDVDFFSGLYIQNIKGIWIEDSLFSIRTHNGNISSSWNEKICDSLIRVHRKIYEKCLKKKQGTKELTEIISKRITSFSMAALSSGYVKLATNNFWYGWKILNAAHKIYRGVYFISFLAIKPFLQNKKKLKTYFK